MVVSVLPIPQGKWRALPILESKLEKDIVDYAETIRYLTFKVSPVSNRGWPDRVFINPSGHHIYMELKKQGKKARKLQAYRMEQLVERNVDVYEVDNLELAKELLDEHLLDAPRISA